MNVVISLDESDLLAMQQILLDEDKDAALEFVKTNVCGKIPQKGSSPCDSSRLNPYLWMRKGSDGQ